MLRIMYLRNNHGNPVGCVVIQTDRTTAEYQLSVLNPKDRFDRDLAKKIAKGRLSIKPMIVSFEEPNPSIHTINTVIMWAIYDDMNSPNSIPMRARKAARNWLRKNDRQVETDN